MIPRLLLGLCLSGVGVAGDSAMEAVLSRWEGSVVKAGQAYAGVIQKADAAVLREAERAALAATRRNDVQAAAAAWTEALRIDLGHARACEALTAMKRLEELRAAVEGENSDAVDLLGGGAPTSDDPELRRAIERRLRTLGEESARRAEAWDRADAAAVPELERLAARSQSKGDAVTVRSIWYEILRLAPGHAKAREFFTVLGQLDEVQAELKGLGDPRQAAVGTGGLHGVAAGYLFQPRQVVNLGGHWQVKDIAGGRPAPITGLAAAPTQPWLTFDGSTTIEVPDPSVVRLLPFTVACWFRPAAQSGAVGLVGDYVGSTWNGFMLQLEGPSVGAWLLRSHGNEVSICSELNSLRVVTWRANEWQHTAVSVDERELVLYADGRLVMRQPWTGQSGPTTQTGPLYIGRYGATYRGDIASVLFWRRALTPGEVAAVGAGTAPTRR